MGNPYKVLLALVFGLALSHADSSAQEVDFNRDVPLFASALK
jgi:hypothetical protein